MKSALLYFVTKAASPEDRFCLSKAQDSYMKRFLLLRLLSHDRESDQVWTGCLFCSLTLGRWVPRRMWAVCLRSLGSASLPQRGQVHVPEQRHQVGKKHSELPREHRPQ